MKTYTIAIEASDVLEFAPGFIKGPKEGASSFVSTLTTKENVQKFQLLIVSGDSYKSVPYYYDSILELFPNIQPSNLLLASRPELLNVDFFISHKVDDLINSSATYKILLAREYRGLCSVDSLSAAHNLISCTVLRMEQIIMTKPKVVCLVGPSGSGKSTICAELCENPYVSMIRSTVTRFRRSDDSDDEYKFVTEAEFKKMIEDHSLVEYTEYAGYHYGIETSEISSITDNGKIAIRPVDIVGAEYCKRFYGKDCLVVFIQREKAKLVESILNRDIPAEDKAKRIMSIEQEYNNASKCDITVSNNGKLKTAVSQIYQLIFQ